VVWTGTGCDSSTAFKALVSPPPVLSAETRSFEDVVAGYAGQLELYCDNCGDAHLAQVTPDHVRATRGDFTKLLPQVAKQQCSCQPHHPQYSDSGYWEQFFDAAWPWVKASDDHEHAMAEHSSRSIFGLV
jgi:hypothetical protein